MSPVGTDGAIEDGPPDAGCDEPPAVDGGADADVPTLAEVRAEGPWLGVGSDG